MLECGVSTEVTDGGWSEGYVLAPPHASSLQRTPLTPVHVPLSSEYAPEHTPLFRVSPHPCPQCICKDTVNEAVCEFRADYANVG